MPIILFCEYLERLKSQNALKLLPQRLIGRYSTANYSGNRQAHIYFCVKSSPPGHS